MGAGPPRDIEQRRQALADGAWAEELVAQRLADQGWRVVARNWRGAGGELDLVVEQGGCLRVVEVKARAPDDPVGLEAIDGFKRKTLARTARLFLEEWPDLVEEISFTVALVHLGPKSVVSPGSVDSVEIEWVDNAFDA